MRRGDTHDVTYDHRGWSCACGDGEPDIRLGQDVTVGWTAAQIADYIAEYAHVEAEAHGEYFGAPARKVDA